MHVLIAVASKHEATRGIADAIAAGLIERKLHATVEDVDALTGIDPHFDAVVLGSAVYAGRWLRAAREFARAYEGQLRDRPVWLFSSGPVGEERPLPEGGSTDVAGLVATTGAVAHQEFAGRLDTHGLGFIERSMVRALHAETGDFRDWTAIDAFAATIAAELQHGATKPTAEPTYSPTSTPAPG